MVAIVSGNDLGLANTSAGVLGGDGLFGNAATGNAGEQAYVNVANGNLVLQDQDDYLASIGTDVALTRTYNSQGVLDATDAIKQWETGLERAVNGLTGVVNTAGSTLSRTGADGGRTVFTYDTNRGAYISTAGGGAFDSITYDSKKQTYTWHSDAADPNSMSEQYDAVNGGRIVSVSEVGGVKSVTVTDKFKVAQSGLSSNRITGLYTGTATITNRTDAPVDGPIRFYLNGLTPGVVLQNATGYENGVPFIDADKASVAPGESVQFTTIFSNPNKVAIGYTPSFATVNATPVTLKYSYNTAGKIASVLDQSGELTSFHYDTRGNLTSVGTSKPAAPGAAAPVEFVRVHYSYDTLNRLTMSTVDLAPEATQAGAAQATSYATSYTYDGVSNRVASLTQQDGSRLAFEYVLNGGGYKVSSFTDALNRQTTFAYGNGVTTVTDPKGNVATYRFDAAGELLGSSITSAAGDETIAGHAFAYDAQGNVISMTDNNGTTLYAYDAVGSLVRQQNPDGAVVNRTYDAANHQLSTQWTTEPAEVITNGTFDDGSVAWTLVGASGPGNPGGNRATASAGKGGENPGPGPVMYYPAIADGELSFTYPASAGAGNGPMYAHAYNTFATVPGESYEVTFVARVDTAPDSASGMTNFLKVVAGSANAVSVASADGDTYRTYTVSFTATEATSSVDIQMNVWSGQTVAVNDVSVKKIEVTRYYYDAGNDKPRFTVTPDGRITEMRYNATNDLVSTIVYGAFAPPTADLTHYTTADIQALAASFDQTKTARTDYGYDVRGLLAATTAYAKTDAAGAGIADGTASVTRFVYDQAGQLLQTIDADNNATTFTYDGLGRTLSTTDAKQNSSISTYDDANNRVTVSSANGLVQTMAYDKAGQLVAMTENGIDSKQVQRTTYTYDADGLLRVTENPLGERTYMYYDVAGYLMATIDAEGSVVQLERNGEHQVVTTTEYTTPLMQDELDALVTNDLVNVLQPYASVRPRASMGDRNTYNTYDTSGRLVTSIDGNNALTTYAYDHRGMLVTTTWYATADGIESLPSPDDRILRNFFDDDGILVAQLDPEGYLTEYVYDAHGWKTENILHAVPVDAGRRDGATVADLAVAASAKDVHEYALYNGKGQQVGSVDGDGYLSESSYDAAGNLVATMRYASPVAYTAGATIDALRPSQAQAGDRTWRYTYNALNQRVTAVEPDGVTVTNYTYNVAGALVASTQATGTAATTGAQMRYDLKGNVTASLGAEGVALLPADPNDKAGADAVWAAYATHYMYDAAGERTGMTDPLGNRTVYFYDDVGRLRYTVSPLGNVTEQRYNTFGQVDAITAHAVPIALSGAFNMLRGGRLTDDMQARFDALASSADSSQYFEYDHAGQVVDVTDAMQFITVNEYNAFGEVVRQTAVAQAGNADPAAPGSASVRTFYDKDGRVLATLDTLGSLAAYRYDERGNVLERVAFHNAIDPASSADQVKQIIASGALADPARDARQLFVYNQRGLPTATFTSIDGNAQAWSVSTSTYDAAGMVVATQGYAAAVVGADPTALPQPYATSAADSATRIMYDLNGRPALVATRTDAPDATGAPNWAIQQQQYDAAGNVVASTVFAVKLAGADPAVDLAATDFLALHGADPANQVTRFAYDSANRVSVQAVAQDAGHWAVTRYTYDKAGNLLQTTESSSAMLSIAPTPAPGPAEYKAWLLAGAPASSTDRITRFGYDSENRLINTLDAMGALVSRTIDAKGNVIATTAYATPLNLVGQLPRDYHAAANPAVDRIDRTVYDLNGRAVTSIDALGNATGMVYDAFGNVVTMTAYAAPLAYPATAPQPDAARDRTERYVYDQAQRLRYTIDPAGFVTESSYDALGRVASNVAYGAAYGGAADLASLDAARPALAPARSNVYDYDARGLMLLHIDPVQAVERFTYDALGNQSSATNMNGVTTGFAYDSVGRLIHQITAPFFAYSYVGADLTPALTTIDNFIAYDALGNVIARTEVAGGVSRTTTYGYDLAGRQVRTTLPSISVYNPAADPLAPGQLDRTEIWPATGATTVVVYDVFGDAIANTDALGNVSRKVYDQAGRVVADIDALGYVTLQSYDTFGDTVKITRTAASVLPALALVQGVQMYELILGRAPEAGAAEGVAGALLGGQSFTQVAEYFFASPEGQSLYPAGMDVGVLVTQLFANATGRAPTATELAFYTGSLNAGMPRGAVADAILHSVTAPADLQFWNAKTEAVAPTAGAAVRQRATQVYTAVLGRAPSSAELASALLFLVGATPEALANQLIASPEGQQLYAGERPVDRLYVNITGHAAGEMYKELATLWASNPGATALFAVELAAATGGADAAYFASHVAANTIPQPVIGIDAGQLDLAGALALLAGLPHNEDRILVQRFDQLGRVLTVTEASGLFSMATNVNGVSNAGIVQGHKQTTNTYNSFGDMLSQSVGLVDDATGAPMADAAVTLFAYNLRGEKVAQFVLANTSASLAGAGAVVAGLQEDFGGYLTTMGYDAAGNLIRVTEFATLVDQAALVSGGQLNVAQFAAAVPVAAFDRVTDFTYDGQDNRTAEIHLASDINVVTLDGAQTVRKDIHTWSTYDLMGNLLAVTDELGGATYSYYDSVGQVRAVASASKDGNFTLTTFDRDGFGNVVRRVDYVNGARDVTAAGFTIVAPDAANDRVTLTVYDTNGNAIVESDAANNTLYTSYDLLGRAAKQWQALGQAKLDSNTDLDWGTVFKIMDYDAVGQLVGVNSSGATGTLGSPDGSFNLTRSTSAFNAFGEAVQKSVNGAVVQVARYDTLGRTWLTNADDGSYKAVFYDVQGNVTTTLRSDVVDGAAGSLVTFNSAQEVAAVQDQFIRTDTQYDLMGRMIRANAPGSNVYQRNDRWGNLIERTDPRNSNWSVKYTYNWRNELLEEVNVVKTAGEAGYTETVAKAVSTFYDELGRQVGMRDANMNASGTGRLTKTMTYDQQGQMLAEYHADGGLTSSVYNLFGDRTMVTVQVNADQANTTRFGYDHLSHLIDTWSAPVATYYLASPTDASDMHLTGLGAVELHLHYDYDSIGNRYQTIASDGGVTRSRYDLDGNVVGTRDPVGIVVQYSFDAQHHRTGQLNGDGLWMNWQYDATGKLVSHVDLGGATVSYGYDGRGQLVSQTSTVRGGTGSAQDIVSTYDATGLLLTVDDRTSGIRTTYTYDLAGNRTGERTDASSRNTGVLIPNGPQSYENTAVTELYWAVSGHGPDDGGRAFWVWHMQEGTSREEIVDRFFDEDGINALYPPDVDFATSLYKNALNRLPTAEEAAIVNNALAGGASRGEVIVDFIDNMSAPGDVAFFDARVNSTLYFQNDNPVPDYSILAQNNTNVYDNLGRITDITDGKYTVNFTYDANGNRIQVHTHYDDEQGTVDTVAVNTFDVMDRQLMVNGTRDADGNVVIGTFGHLLTYDLVGNRTTDTYLGDTAVATSVTRERFDYDALGRLTFTHRTANGTSDEYRIDERKYDMGSRIIESGVGSGLPEETINALEAMDIETNSRQYYYDLAGKTLRQKIFDGEGGTPNAGKLQDIFYYSSSSQDPNGNDSDIGYDAAGNLKGYYIVPQGGSDGDQVVYRMTYAHFDGYVQTKLSVTRGDGGDANDYRETNSTYNQNGFLVQVQVGDDPAPRTFINDIDGHILRKTSGDEVTTTLIVNGEVLGSSGGPRDAMVGYFATNYTSTTESGAATAPTVYMAQEGDTLQSIARSIWGDARLWYLIADANGIAGDAELKAGDQLVIPPKVNTVNSNYQAYKPYDPSKLIGDTTPVLPAPTGGGGGGGGGGCGILGAIISIFVAVVAFAVLGPVGDAFAAGIGLGETTAAFGIVSAAATGVVASVVSQGIGIAIGTQDSFSWKSVALAGISAGVTEGLLGPANAVVAGGTRATTPFLGLQGAGAAVARAAVGNALTQGISIAVGLQDGFNWRSVLASGASAGVSELVIGGLGGNRTNFGVDLASHAASSATQQLIQDGRVSLSKVVSDAFGNALGNSVAAKIQVQRAISKVKPSSVSPFQRDREAREAMNPLTNDGRTVPGENYRYVGGKDDYDYDLSIAARQMLSAERPTEQDDFDALYKGPKVYVTGHRLTPLERQALIIQDRINAEYGNRANYESVMIGRGVVDNLVNTVVGVGKGVAGTFRYVTGDQATRNAVANASNRLSSMPIGSILNAGGRAIVDASPLGIAAALADGDPYGAGGRLGGAVVGMAIPLAGKVAGEAFEAASQVGLKNVAAGVSEIADVAPPSRSGFIFRGDDRGPDLIFKDGLQPRGSNTDLYDYAANNVPSIYVPTSTSPNVARYFAELQEGGYVYTIRGQSQGIDVNAVLGKSSPHWNEFEIAVPNGISPSDIMGARVVTPDGKFAGPFIKNPIYKP